MYSLNKLLENQRFRIFSLFVTLILKAEKDQLLFFVDAQNNCIVIY